VARFANLILAQAVLAASLAGLAWASDHHDPPALADDPAVDIADIYAFARLSETGPNAVIVMTLVGQPELDVRYRMLFDTTPEDDAGGFSVDSQLELWFTPNPAGGDEAHCLNFAMRSLVLSSCLNPAWHTANGDYSIDFSLEPVLGPGSGRVGIFGGWRDDPFFFDEHAFGAFVSELRAWSEEHCDSSGTCECAGGGTGCFIPYPPWNDTAERWDPVDLAEVAGLPDNVDAYAGRNVYAFVVEAPGGVLGATSIRAYAASYRRASRIRTPQGDLERGPWVQMDRMAVPGLSTGLLPDDETRLLYNRDSVDTSYAATLAESITTLRVLASRALLAFNHPDRPAPTLAPTIPELLALIDPDVAHLNLLPTANPPFGFFRNGRTLFYRVGEQIYHYDAMDAVLSMVLGIPVTDGVDANDVAFLGGFPYLAPPHGIE
jgi:hypothetical protein